VDNILHFSEIEVNFICVLYILLCTKTQTNSFELNKYYMDNRVLNNCVFTTDQIHFLSECSKETESEELEITKNWLSSISDITSIIYNRRTSLVS
jgi:hypothetical protein